MRQTRWISCRTEVSRSGSVQFAVKIFRDHDFGRQQRPGLGHFDIFLFENDLAGVVGDFGGALVPFDLVERLDLGIAENACAISSDLPLPLPAWLRRLAVVVCKRLLPLRAFARECCWEGVTS